MQATVEPVETGAIVTQAQTLTIASHADNEAAGRFMVECKALRQKVCDNYDPAIEAAHAAGILALCHPTAPTIGRLTLSPNPASPSGEVATVALYPRR